MVKSKVYSLDACVAALGEVFDGDHGRGHGEREDFRL